MFDQRLADAGAEDHVEHAGRHAGAFDSADQRFGHTFGRSHVAAVGLEHHRATGGQSGGGVTASRGERQRKVAGTEDRHRADTDAVLTQVRTRQRSALR
ncbi:hypothetical protein D3C71_1040140 [compost metagenome]